MRSTQPCRKKLTKSFRLAQMHLKDCSLAEVRHSSPRFHEPIRSCWAAPYPSCSTVLLIAAWSAQQHRRCGTSHQRWCSTAFLPMPPATLLPTSALVSEMEARGISRHLHTVCHCTNLKQFSVSLVHVWVMSPLKCSITAAATAALPLDLQNCVLCSFDSPKAPRANAHCFLYCCAEHPWQDWILRKTGFPSQKCLKLQLHTGNSSSSKEHRPLLFNLEQKDSYLTSTPAISACPCCFLRASLTMLQVASRGTDLGQTSNSGWCTCFSIP